jgi:ribosomal protein S18 acetylase RimI-like enzyme
MKPKLTYSDANVEDAELLSSIAFNSKKFWGYSDELMNVWRSDLEISTQYILKNKVVKVFLEEKLIGFFGIKFIDSSIAEIDHLWIKPENIRRNFGRDIFNHIIDYLLANGFNKTTLIAEPNAIGFYQKMNGQIVGKSQSKISGRILDIYEFQVKTATNR